MAATVQDVIDIMDRIAPPWMAHGRDPIGLHAGQRRRRVRRLLVTLDATLAAVDRARKRGCQMIVCHHPRFYQPLATLDEDTPMGALAAAIVRARLAVYCAHTNLDAAPGGTNDTLADLVGLVEAQPINLQAEDRGLKLAAFVPDSHLAAVRTALCDAGAGVIGEYTDCSFRTAGIGTFKGSDASKPYVGHAGQFEEAEEWRLEVLLSESLRAGVVQALRHAHPYEEPAFDLYPLADGDAYGCGRVGCCRKPVTLKRLAQRLKKACKATGVLAAGEPQAPLARIAVWAGAACPVNLVVRLGVDAVVLGEIGYHDSEILAQAGVACIALGHGPCEEIVLPHVVASLQEGLPGVEVDLYTEGTPRMWSV